ncbi:MAG: hypothetical protein JXR95_02210 [Deltaproteobacteria bacterium]|nr:hypothetical protein [Deltaproteobacteria bacterium]
MTGLVLARSGIEGLFSSPYDGISTLISPRFLLMSFAVLLFIVLWNEMKKEEDERDGLLPLKTGFYLLEIFAIQYAVSGVFFFLNFLLSKMTDAALPSDALKAGLGYLLGGIVTAVGIELAIVFMGKVEKNVLPRKLAFTLMLLMFGFMATDSTVKLVGSIAMFPKGASFHVPLTAFIVFVAATFFGVMYYKAVFGGEVSSHTFLPSSFVDKANNIVEKSGVGTFGAAAMGGAAGMGMGAAPQQQPQQFSQPMQQQPQQDFSQPMQQQPQQFSQPMQQQPQQFSQPVAQNANACPTCGAAGRHIPQYNRYWCDSCQKYL